MVEIAKLTSWFLAHKRSFPWREKISPYGVWISEVMLQQTRASVVVSYYRRWMTRLPTLEALANASLEEVMKLWEGLGYYSRVRNIKKAAEYLLQEHKGAVPVVLEDLKKVPGIGSYTAGAILSFAYHQRAPAIDGNVSRVIARYHGIADLLERADTKKKIEATTSLWLTDAEPWVAMEALIELGALVCLPTPRCWECPLKQGCRAYLERKVEIIPLKKKRKQTVHLACRVWVISCQDSLLIYQKQEGKVLEGLFEFPSADLYSQEEPFSFLIQWIEDLPMQKQSYTHHALELYPAYYEAKEQTAVDGYRWVPYKECDRLSFSSGHKKILRHLSHFH